MGNNSWLALALLPVIYNRQVPIEGSIVPFHFMFHSASVCYCVNKHFHGNIRAHYASARFLNSDTDTTADENTL